MVHTKDLNTGQVTRPEEFFNWWLLYWASASPLEWQNLHTSIWFIIFLILSESLLVLYVLVNFRLIV